MESKGNNEHVAVLVCDTPIPSVAEKFGDFGDNMVDGLKKVGSEIVVEKYQVVYGDGETNGDHGEKLDRVYEVLKKRLIEKKVKGIILTGSRNDSFASNQWLSKLDEFIQSYIFPLDNFPIVGICFGHQIVAKNLGSKVGRNAKDVGWELGTTTITLNKDINGVENSPFASALFCEATGKLMGTMNLIESHQDIVFGLPPLTVLEKRKTSVRSIGSTNKCSIQGLVTDKGPLKILTFQGHPEFTQEEFLEMLKVNEEKGTLDKSLCEKAAYNTRILCNQGPLVWKIINNFLQFYLTNKVEV